MIKPRSAKAKGSRLEKAVQMALQEAGAKARGFTQLSHVLEVHGICPRCAHG